MLEDIKNVVKKCGMIIKEAQIQNVEFKNQDRRNLVTEYDVKVQSLLQKRLKEILPNASFLAKKEHIIIKKILIVLFVIRLTEQQIL